LDLEHIAEEIEDVGKSEQRELSSRMVVLLAHLLKWQYQPARRGSSWERTIKVQRTQVIRCLKKTPSLKSSLQDQDWLDSTWDDAITQATNETGIELTVFPESCPWASEQILDQDFFPA
ncbi:MAG TPA: DUF29 domain-containing protein, partial [Agitococcus sp.]|nr:DUF29 domain-containing protein [Agitococcus sp.]